ncbi:hypothetical protein BC833DRAFT_648922 [Globomyces pollinis-pini]|nr:hypothetical protein BC833DRAFT_648922 [Globomyces pollinis-pini]
MNTESNQESVVASGQEIVVLTTDEQVPQSVTVPSDNNNTWTHYFNDIFQAVKYSELMEIYEDYHDEGLYFFLYDESLEKKYLLIIKTITLALLIVFVSLLSFKIDDSLNWSYFIVFIPLYIFDIIALYLILKFKTLDLQYNVKFNNEDKSKRLKLDSQLAILYVQVIEFQIMTCLKLDGIWNVSWWIVFFPIILLEIVNIFFNLILTGRKCFQTVHEINPNSQIVYDVLQRRHSNSKMIRIIFSHWFCTILRILQTFFILCKITFDVNYNYLSWILIFIPLWIYFAFKVVWFLMFIVLQKFNILEDVQQNYTDKNWNDFILNTCALIVTLLLVTRLESQTTPSMGVVFTPVFVVLALLLISSFMSVVLLKATKNDETESDIQL